MINMYGKTHIGKRQLNEDCYHIEPERGVALVADGMGGHAAGEIASDIVTSTAVALLANAQGVQEALAGAHQEVKRAAQDGRGKLGMGATGVIAAFDGNDYQLAWIGDSRAYLWNGDLWQLTRDHSYVEGLLSRGLITLEEAHTRSNRNLITRALGIEDLQVSEVPTVSGVLCRGQQLLLCSDGLNDAITGAEIANILASELEPEDIADELVSAALIAGGKDNITVVLITADENAPEEATHRPEDAVSLARTDGSSEYYPPENFPDDGESAPDPGNANAMQVGSTVVATPEVSRKSDNDDREGNGRGKWAAVGVIIVLAVAAVYWWSISGAL